MARATIAEVAKAAGVSKATVSRVLSGNHKYLTMIDPDNPVVRLCAEGIAAEGQGQHVEAAALYTKAWAIHTDDYEACIAAHYLAREQETLQESLAWNQRAIDHALAVPEEQDRGVLAIVVSESGLVA